MEKRLFLISRFLIMANCIKFVKHFFLYFKNGSIWFLKSFIDTLHNKPQTLKPSLHRQGTGSFKKAATTNELGKKKALQHYLKI